MATAKQTEPTEPKAEETVETPKAESPKNGAKGKTYTTNRGFTRTDR